MSLPFPPKPKNGGNGGPPPIRFLFAFFPKKPFGLEKKKVFLPPLQSKPKTLQPLPNGKKKKKQIFWGGPGNLAFFLFFHFFLLQKNWV